MAATQPSASGVPWAAPTPFASAGEGTDVILVDIADQIEPSLHLTREAD